MEAQLKAPDHPIYIQAVGLNFGHHIHPFHDVHIVYKSDFIARLS